MLPTMPRLLPRLKRIKRGMPPMHKQLQCCSHAMEEDAEDDEDDYAVLHIGLFRFEGSSSGVCLGICSSGCN